MNSFEQLPEKEIIERILKGEKPLYEIIVRRFNPYLYKLGRSYNYNHEDTQDLMQDTFVDAYKNLAQFEGKSEFKTWVSRIMLNHCFHKRQKLAHKNETSMEVKDNASPLFSNSANDTFKMIQRDEMRHIVEDALSKIPEEYRMVFALREINGMNVLETAELLNISEANVKVRLNRSKTMLKKEIENTYSTVDLFEFNLVYCDAIVKNVMHKIEHL